MSTVTAAVVEALLRVRDAGFFVTMKKADEQTKKVEQSVKSVSARLTQFGEIASGVGQTLSLKITAPLIAVGAAAVKTTTDLDALRQGLVKVTGSSAEAERQLARLKVISKQPGLGFEEAIKGSLRLQSAGLSAKQAEGALREFGNAIAAVGGGKEQLDGVTVALSQIASKGKVTAEEINQIAERFYGVREVMQRAFGTSDTEILQAAKLTANEYIDGMVEVLSQDKRVGNSLKNQFETAQDSIKESLDRIGTAIAPRVADVFEKIASAIERVTLAFSKMPREKQDLLTRLGLGTLVAGPILQVIGNVASLASKLEALGVGAKVLAGLTRGGVIGAAVGAIALIGTAFYTYSVDKQARKTEEEAARPYYLDAEQKIRDNRQKISDIESAATARRQQSGGGDSAYLAGIGGLLNPSEEAEIKRLKEENAKLESISSTLRTKAQAYQKRLADEQARQKQSLIDANARAQRLKEQEEKRQEEERERKRRAQEKAENDRRYREEALRTAREAADLKLGLTAPEIVQKQAQARRLADRFRYYGVKDTDEILKLILRDNAIGEVRAQMGGWSFSSVLSSGFSDLSKQAEKRRKLRESLPAGLEALERSTAPKVPLPVPPGDIAQLRDLAPTVPIMGKLAVQGGLTRIQQRARLGGYRAAGQLGGIADAGFQDLVNGRDVIGNALERVKGAVFQGIGEEIGRGVERSLRKKLSSIFEEAIMGKVGDKLGKSLEGSLRGINASAGAILSGAYSLITALSRRKQFGLGSFLGAAAGFLAGGPVGAIQGYNFGNALDNKDYGGAIIGGLQLFTMPGASSGTSSGPRTSFSDVSGLAGVTTGGSSGWTSPPRRSVFIQVVHNGDINGIEDLEGASQRQGRAIERAMSFNG